MASRTSSRKPSAALDPALPQKKRARRRLIGAAAVCLAAAIALPILLDSEPRQVRGDIEAKIPSRDTPLYERPDATALSGTIRRSQGDDERSGGVGAGAAAAAARVQSATAGPSTLSAQSAASTNEVTAATGNGTPAAGANAVATTKPGPGATVSKPADPKVVDAQTRGAGQADARAASTKSVQGKPAASDPIARLAANQESRTAKTSGYIVQIGAFASEKSAADQIARARKAGFTAYKESISTAQGDRIRVRIGPYFSRDEADKVRGKLRAARIESVLIAP
jgi:DedD protein